VASYLYNILNCSWLCSGIHIEMNQLYSIRPGNYGLLQQNEAKQVYEWITEDGYWGLRGEPEPYDYWLLVDYPINES
jgi:hypothetical protein